MGPLPTSAKVTGNGRIVPRQRAIAAAGIRPALPVPRSVTDHLLKSGYAPGVLRPVASGPVPGQTYSASGSSGIAPLAFGDPAGRQDRTIPTGRRLHADAGPVSF